MNPFAQEATILTEFNFFYEYGGEIPLFFLAIKADYRISSLLSPPKTINKCFGLLTRL